MEMGFGFTGHIRILIRWNMRFRVQGCMESSLGLQQGL
jgi:hypothetical protein